MVSGFKAWLMELGKALGLVHSHRFFQRRWNDSDGVPWVETKCVSGCGFSDVGPVHAGPGDFHDPTWPADWAELQGDKEC